MKHKANMEVLPSGSMTKLEAEHTGLSLKECAASVYGIRTDYIGGPGNFYKAEDIENI